MLGLGVHENRGSIFAEATVHIDICLCTLQNFVALYALHILSDGAEAKHNTSIISVPNRKFACEAKRHRKFESELISKSIGSVGVVCVTAKTHRSDRGARAYCRFCLVRVLCKLIFGSHGTESVHDKTKERDEGIYAG